MLRDLFQVENAFGKGNITLFLIIVLLMSPDLQPEGVRARPERVSASVDSCAILLSASSDVSPPRPLIAVLGYVRRLRACPWPPEPPRDTTADRRGVT
jgi:hypothetical protein